MGAIGCVHLKAFQTQSDAQITAICDADTCKLSDVAEKAGINNLFTDYNDLLKSDVDAVCVCVGNHLHRDVAVAALFAGKHVLIEKPMAINLNQAEEIVEVAEKTDRVVQIGMSLRYHPAIRVLRKFIDDGMLGDIYNVKVSVVRQRGIPGLGRWFTTKSKAGGGPLIDIGVHWLDLSMWLGGMWNPVSVSGEIYAKFGSKMREYNYINMWAGPPDYQGTFDVEDFATGFAKFDNGTTLSYDFAWAANAANRMVLEILGDKGGARLENLEDLKIYTEHNGRLVDVIPKYDKINDNFEVQAGCFISACRGLGKTTATAEEGLAVMKLIDATYKNSINNGKNGDIHRR